MVAYLHDSIGLAELNLAILAQIAAVLVGLGKPYFILADWNITPEVLNSGGWLNGIGARVCEAGRPTCIQGDTCRTYDYAAVSAHWLETPKASLYESWAPGPHTAILFEMPFLQPTVMVTAIRKPKTFPAQPPYGPFREDTKPTSDRGFRFADGNGTDDLEKACVVMYKELEIELADKYAVDAVSTEERHGRTIRNPYTGRGTDLGTKSVPIFQVNHGISSGNHVSAFYRRMNARLREFVFLRDKADKSRQEILAMWDLCRSLPRAKPPGDGDCLQWRSWKAHTRTGMWDKAAPFLRSLASYFLDRARSIESKLGAERSRSYREWLRRTAPHGDASVYRWIRERPPFIAAPVDNHLGIIGYHDSCDAKAKVFTDVWEKDPPEALAGEIVWPPNLHLIDLDLPLDPDGVRRTSTCFRISTSYGTDVVHPRQVGLLSCSLIWFMIEIILTMIKRGLTTEAVNLILVKLIPKVDGGERPIGLFSGFLRVLLKALRRTIGQTWLQDKIPPHWYGVKGRPSSQAAWTRLIAARYAKATGAVAIGSLYDVTKAFDHLVWKAIHVAATELEFPMALLRFLIHLYGCVRRIVIGKGIVRLSKPKISVLAGCVFADIMMFLVMTGIDSKVRKAAPLAQAAVVADDYQLLICKPREQAIRILLRAHAACVKAFNAVGLPVSAKKQILVSSDGTAAADIADADPSLMASRRQTARNLGIDYTLGRRRYTLVFAGRVHKTKKKFLKIKAIRSVGVDSSHYVVSIINSSHTYGSDCIGASPSQVKKCRAAAHRGVTRSPTGRSATFDLALSRAQPTALDTTYRLNSGAIVALASALWDNWVPRHWILRTWNEAFLQANDVGFSWNTVNDGMMAVAATCKRISWTSFTPGCFLTEEGIKINCDVMCPKSIKLLADRATETAVLRQAVANDADLRVLGPQAVPWMLPLRRLVSQKPNENWNPLHQSMLRCCVARGLWPPQRLKDAGIIEDGSCYLCGGPGTVFHRVVHCPGRHSFRYNYGLPENTLTLARASPADPLWTRAIVPDPTRLLPPPTDLDPTWTVLPSDGRKVFTAEGFGDGSGVSPFGPASARCGFAVIQIRRQNGMYVLDRCLVGPLPGPIQATPAAEACALYHYALHAIDKTGLTFYSDCQWVVDGFAGGPVATTGACHVHADLWRRIWAVLKQRQHHLFVEKVKAHVTSKDMAEGYSVFLKEGNAFADAGAKLGRTHHPRDADLEKKVSKAYVLLQIIARFLARISVVAMEAGDDMPPIVPKAKEIMTAVTLEGRAKFKHCAAYVEGRIRCLWCLRTADSESNLDRMPCNQAGGHAIWKVGPVIICSRCGGYSRYCARLLSKPCCGHVTDTRRNWLRRVFDSNLHPVDDVKLPPPTFWRKSAPQQKVDPYLVLKSCKSSDQQNSSCVDPVETLFRHASALISEEDCKLKSFDLSEADGKAYADAVKGATPASDAKGVKIAHVGTACASSDPEHWDPWLGRRVVHPMTKGPAVPSGSKLRNRFCLNPAERERRRFDCARASETVLHDTTKGDHLLESLPAFCDFARGNGYQDVTETEAEAGDPEHALDEEDFWNNLEELPIDDGAVPLATFDVCRTLSEYTLFEHTPDADGLADAILDMISLIEDGQVANIDECCEAVVGAAEALDLPAHSSSDSPEDASRWLDGETKRGYEADHMPLETDGLPSEDTIAFLFDHATEEQVQMKVSENSAFQRLADLRARVLARLNRQS